MRKVVCCTLLLTCLAAQGDVVLTNNLDVALKFGEQYPPQFSGDSAKR